MCLAPQNNLLELDPQLPNRDELLDAESMKQNLSQIIGLKLQSCEIIRAKYQVNSSLRVLYKIVADDLENYVSARVYAESPAGADYFVFPEDRKIQNLDLLNSPPKSFPGLWNSSKVVAYAPEKCVTVECLDTSQNVFAYAKLYTEREFKTGEKVFRFLTEQTAERLFPKVLAFDEVNKVLLLENITGKRLSELDEQQAQTGFRQLGKSIAKLHNLSTLVELPIFSRLTPNRIKTALKVISQTRPDCRVQTEKLAEKLSEDYSFAEEAKVILHGDVHLKNGILQADETLRLIDLDQLSYGNAAAEIGSFLAGLFYKEIVGLISKEERRRNSAVFLQSYAEVRQLPSLESLNWHTATALFTERAWRSISRIRVEGLQKFSEILTTSEQLLEGEIL